MDTIKIGKFLASLRKEKNYTQTQLGEKIGVTNKTISRWENGNYLPSVDMLRILSEEFSVSINEILNGERVKSENCKAVAEKNSVDVLRSSTFALAERKNYWRKKWLKEHLVTHIVLHLIIAGLLTFVLLTYGTIESNIDMVIVVYAYAIASVAFERNRMTVYIEKKVF